MKTYEAYVSCKIGRSVIVEAHSEEEAELEAAREFKALVGAERDVEVVDIREYSDDCPRLFTQLSNGDVITVGRFLTKEILNHDRK